MKLTEIALHPIKSAGRILVDAATVDARGLRHDRRYMLVDANGKFLTQRQHPRMALLHVALDEGALTVSTAGRNSLSITDEMTLPERRLVTVWGEDVRGNTLPAEVDAWFSEFLGFECHLVHMAEEERRAVDPTYGQAGDIVSFADGFPFLLISENSLAELNARLAKPVSMAQFRPNLVVRADQAFAEDGWKRIRIGECEFELVKPCSRCVLTTVDPERGIADPGREPLKTLSSYRRREGGVMFGQNLIARRLGTVRVGDEVEVLA